MRIKVVMFASLLVAGAAQAQSVPSPTSANDDWSAPAPASTAGYRAGNARPLTEPKQQSHFKFKERGYKPPSGNAAQEQSGKAAVGAMGTVDRNGRPAVSCPDNPMDPACH